jgi:hypothetical protein
MFFIHSKVHASFTCVDSHYQIHQNITTLQNFALPIIRTKLKINENIHKYEDCVPLGYHTASLGNRFMALYRTQLPCDAALCNRRSDFSDTLLWKLAV